MASQNKLKKMINSYCWSSLKNTVQEMKLKRVLFYTANDRKMNKKVDCNNID
jgi:hypothetical protein